MKPYKITSLRWSMLSAWDYDPEQFYRVYVLGEKQTSAQLTFGSYVDEKLQIDPTFIPAHPRYPVKQHPMKVMFDGLLLTGTADWIDFDTKQLWDTKTGVQPWTQSRADDHGQLTMYLLMLYIANKKLKPEEWTLGIHWLPTQKTEHSNFDTNISFRDNPPVPITFHTKRTMLDLLAFCARIKRTIKEMEEYVNNHD